MLCSENIAFTSFTKLSLWICVHRGSLMPLRQWKTLNVMVQQIATSKLSREGCKLVKLSLSVFTVTSENDSTATNDFENKIYLIPIQSISVSYRLPLCFGLQQ